MSNDDAELRVLLRGDWKYDDVQTVYEFVRSRGLEMEFRIPRELEREGVGPKPDDIDALRRTAAELAFLSQRLTKEVVNVVMTTDSGAFTLRAT